MPGRCSWLWLLSLVLLALLLLRVPDILAAESLGVGSGPPGFSILRRASCSDMLYVTHTATHHVNRFYSIFLKGNECCVQYAKAQGQGGRRQAAAGHGANGPSRPIADTAGRGMESSGDGRPRHELDGSTADHLVGREVLESSAEVRLEASTAKRCGGGSGDRRLL